MSENVTMNVVHYGGPWDGLREMRKIPKAPNPLRIEGDWQSLDAGQAFKAIHSYDVEISTQGVARLRYLGVDSIEKK
jgi:hypothetical protein